MKQLTSHSFKKAILSLSFLFFICVINAQVGIGTTNPNADALLEIDATTISGGLLLPRIALTSSTAAAPLSAHVQGMLVYNTATAGDVRPGQYYNDGMKWTRVEGSDPIDSVTLTTDETIVKGSPGPMPPVYAAVNGMNLTFTARKTSVMVQLSASGFGPVNSMGYVQVRVRNTTSGTTIGGTMTKIQSYEGGIGTITPWSCSFSKLLSGLTIGTSYTLIVEARSDSILGADTAVIWPASDPDTNHLTLSVLQ